MMGKVWLPWMVAIAALLVVATQNVGVAEAPPIAEHRPLVHHLSRAITHLDQGSRSPEYRESLAYLRLHAREAAAALSGPVLREPGSFRKWQITYLIGDFGDESAIALLRIFTEQQSPRLGRPGQAVTRPTSSLARR